MYKKIIAALVVVLVMYIVFSYLESNKNTEQWKADFDYIISEIEKIHPAPYRVLSKSSFANEFDNLLAKVNKLNDEEITFEIASLVARLHDGHTSLAWNNYLTDQYYPVRFRIIDNKLYATKTLENYRDLAYKEIVTINGYDPNTVIDKIASYCSYENQYYKNFLVESRLSFYDFYKNTGLLSQSNALILTVKNKNENMYLTFELPVVNREKIQILSNDFEWSDKLYGVYNYNFEYDEFSKVIVFNYNVCYEDENMPFSEFNNQMWKFINEHDVNKIVIDLSRNLGGNSNLFASFINQFAESDLNQKGKAFAIIGNQNYSAGTEAVARLKRLTSIILIGEPTGGSPQMFGNTKYIKSPNKGICIVVAMDEFDNYPNYKHEAIMPDILIEKTIEDVKENNNPILDYIMNN